MRENEEPIREDVSDPSIPDYNQGNTEQVSEGGRGIFVKNDFLEMIRNGQKTVEVRVAFPEFRDVRLGEKINFSSSSGPGVNVIIERVDYYNTIEDVLTQEDINKILPNTTLEDARRKAGQIFRLEDASKYGLVAFEFRLI